MGRVTNLVLSFSLLEDEASRMAEVNTFFGLGRGYKEKGLVSVHDECLTPRYWYGGSKVLTAPLWIGAFNYLDLAAFLAHLRTCQWEDSLQVHLFVKESECEWRIER